MKYPNKNIAKNTICSVLQPVLIRTWVTFLEININILSVFRGGGGGGGGQKCTKKGKILGQLPDGTVYRQDMVTTPTRRRVGVVYCTASRRSTNKPYNRQAVSRQAVLTKHDCKNLTRRAVGKVSF